METKKSLSLARVPAGVSVGRDAGGLLYTQRDQHAQRRALPALLATRMAGPLPDRWERICGRDEKMAGQIEMDYRPAVTVGSVRSGSITAAIWKWWRPGL